MLLRDSLGASVVVHFVPRPDVSELPITSYYRFVGPQAQPLLTKALNKAGVCVCVFVWAFLSRISVTTVRFPLVVSPVVIRGLSYSHEARIPIA